MPEERGHTKNIADFEQLIAILTALGTTYNPSNQLLKLADLNALLNRAKTSVANNAQINVTDHCATSNETLYNETDGLKTRVGLIKNYLKSVLDKKIGNMSR